MSLITIGNQLRGDDGVAMALCDLLPDSILQIVQRYDLGPYVQLIGECVQNDAPTVVIDATSNGNPVGTVTRLDLLPILSSKSELSFRSCHSISFVDELRLLQSQRQLPENLIFLGIEISETDWTDQISAELRKTLPAARDQLISIINNLSDN